MTAFDVLIIGVAAVGFYFGWQRGLLRKVFGLVGLVMAVLAANYLAPLLVQTGPLQRWRQRLIDFLQEQVSPLQAAATDVGDAAVAAALQEAVADLPLPSSYRSHLVERVAIPSEGVTDTLTELLASGIVSAVLFMALLAAAYVILRFVLALVADIISLTPVIGSVNRLIGGLLGALQYLLVTALLLALALPFHSLPAFAAVARAQSASTLAPHLVDLLAVLVRLAFGARGFLGWG